VVARSVVAAQLYGVVPTDAVAIGGAVLVLTTVAIIAGLVPSVRAARVDPTRALRFQ
jgi:ABC-type antimicrobial peptide transport system permease subunit